MSVFILNNILMKIQWRPVKEFPGHYEVNNVGQVRRIKGTSHLKQRIIKCHADKDGYRIVNLKIKSKSHKRRVHRLVASSFNDNPENKPQVNHINGIKDDNRHENLQWVTLSENRQHAYDTGLQNSKSRQGVNSNFAKLTEEDVLEIRKLYKRDLRGLNRSDYNGSYTMKEIGIKFGVSQECISNIINRK